MCDPGRQTVGADDGELSMDVPDTSGEAMWKAWAMSTYERVAGRPLLVEGD